VPGVVTAAKAAITAGLAAVLVAAAAAGAAAPGDQREPRDPGAGVESAAKPAPADAYPSAAAAYLVVVNGVELWARAPDRALPPASLTKILTALVLLDDWRPESIVTVSATAAAATGSRIGLRAGDRIRLGDAFDALLVGSANDACLALAEHAAGSADRFVERMNAKAVALGLAASRFRDPCGFDQPGHLASVRDLHALAARAMQSPAFARAVELSAVELRTQGGRRLRKTSSNLLLGRVPGAIGVKTGYTRGAGKCLAALVRRGRDEVSVVLLDAPDRWWAASILIDDAFAALAAARRE